MSLIEQLGTDLESNTRLLQEWVAHTRAVSSRLDEHEQSCRTGQAQLEESLAQAKGCLTALAVGAQDYLASARHEATQTHQHQQKTLAGIGRETGRLETHVKSVLEMAAQTQEALKAGRARVSSLAAEAEAAFHKAATARQSFSQDLRRNQQECLAEVAGLQTFLHGQMAAVTRHIGSVQEQLSRHLQELAGPLHERSRRTYELTASYLAGHYTADLSKRLTTLQQAAQTSVAGLVGPQVASVRDEVKANLSECFGDVQKYAQELPEKLEREGKSVLKSQAHALDEETLAALGSSIASTTTAVALCAEGVPLLKLLCQGLDQALGVPST